MIDQTLLWKGAQHAPLIFIIPGGTGSQRSQGMPGFNIIPEYFQRLGFSCYLGETAGQDERKGVFSLQRCLNENREAVKELIDELDPTGIVLFASCSGGTIATYLAAEVDTTHSLILWESLPRYSAESREGFVARAPAKGIRLAKGFLDEYLETVDAAPRVRCSVLLLHGDSEGSQVQEEDVRELARHFTQAEELRLVKIPGADHNLTRGSNLEILDQVLDHICEFLEHHRVRNPAGRPHMDEPDYLSGSLHTNRSTS